MKIVKVIFALVFVIAGGAAFAAAVLTGKNGMTLYTFDKDSPGKSVCEGKCIEAWPAARAGDAGGRDFAEITRSDGSKQLTYQGKPLYYWVKDKQPGDVTGESVPGWRTVPLK